jgi:adenylate cyclase, class 2
VWYDFDMETEFETRFLDINKEQLISQIILKGGTDKGEFKTQEIIFYDAELHWLKGNQFIRLREKNNIKTLTYKKHIGHGVDSAREIEFVISDMDKAKEFLEQLGYIAYRIVEKIRHSLELDNVIIDIDTWPKIPTYVELEGDSVDELKKVSKKLDLNWEDRFDKDPRFVYQHYGYDFDKLRSVTFDKFE